jgi:hypothetical protein
MSGFNGMSNARAEIWNISTLSDGAILSRWQAGLDTLSIARELCLPESVVFNRLFHAREARRRDAEWNFDRIAMGSSS